MESMVFLRFFNVFKGDQGGAGGRQAERTGSSGGKMMGPRRTKQLTTKP